MKSLGSLIREIRSGGRIGLGQEGLARTRGRRERAPQNYQSTDEKKVPCSPHYLSVPPLLLGLFLGWSPPPGPGLGHALGQAPPCGPALASGPAPQSTGPARLFQALPQGHPSPPPPSPGLALTWVSPSAPDLASPAFLPPSCPDQVHSLHPAPTRAPPSTPLGPRPFLTWPGPTPDPSLRWPPRPPPHSRPQALRLHRRPSSSTPSQPPPSMPAAGRQVRVRVCKPPPQSRVHSPHSDHSFQPPGGNQRAGVRARGGDKEIGCLSESDLWRVSQAGMGPQRPTRRDPNCEGQPGNQHNNGGQLGGQVWAWVG